MAAYKLLKDLKESLKKVEESRPGNWLGHWAKSIRMKSIKHRICEIEDDLKNRKKK
jgi:hypothetical protein